MQTDASTRYQVWRADGKAEAPVELPALVTLIKRGKVKADSWIYSETTQTWARAAEFVELKTVFGAKTRAERPAEASGLKPGTLRRIKIFADMDAAQLEVFVRYIEVVRIKQFATVVRKGDHGDAMYLVLEGELRARVLIEEKESTLSTLAVGDAFGEISLLDHGPRSADIIANQDSVVLRITAEAVRRIAVEAPAVATPFLYALGRSIAGRVRTLTRRYEDAIHLSRVAAGFP